MCHLGTLNSLGHTCLLLQFLQLLKPPVLPYFDFENEQDRTRLMNDPTRVPKPFFFFQWQKIGKLEILTEINDFSKLSKYSQNTTNKKIKRNTNSKFCGETLWVNPHFWRNVWSNSHLMAKIGLFFQFFKRGGFCHI